MSVTGLGLYDRRVHIYAHEYRVYGPDGLRVLFERNAQGVFVKRAVTLDAQGSIATVTDAAGYHHAEIHDDHGERTTVPQRRTGWLDRELDYETAPGHVRHRLYDLDHRKYDAATAQFLSVDPLWPMFISSGSYVYCTGDAVNKIDPWGLGEDIMPRPRSPRKTQQPGTGTSPLNPGTDSPMIVGHEAEYYRGVGAWLYDIAIGRYLRGLGATGDGIGPYGSGPGQSWVASPRGIGPGGKGLHRSIWIAPAACNGGPSSRRVQRNRFKTLWVPPRVRLPSHRRGSQSNGQALSYACLRTVTVAYHFRVYERVDRAHELGFDECRRSSGNDQYCTFGIDSKAHANVNTAAAVCIGVSPDVEVGWQWVCVS